jgi:CoA:oxalate CoA-transferase
MGVLDGIRVVDLTQNLAGPYSTMILADLGAEVIKVEKPGIGDDARGFGPFLNGISVYFMSVNRGKKGISVDLKNPKGRDLLLGLLSRSDVLVESFRPGVMDRLGLSYEAVRRVNESILYASVSGFGQTGPYREKPAYDAVVQGYGGIMSITGSPDGPPTKVGMSMGDIAAGLYLAIGLLGSLVSKQKTGRGERIDVALLDCQLALIENAVARFFLTGEVPGRIGNRHPSITPFQSFPTRDGYLVLCIGNQPLWETFCRTVSREDLLGDPRFVTNASRTENHGSLEPLLCDLFRPRPTAEWLALLDGAGIPCGPVNDVGQITRNEQILAREMIVPLDHPEAGPFTSVGSPIKLLNHSTRPTLPAPGLGQHNDEILGLVGLSPEEIEGLRSEGII